MLQHLSPRHRCDFHLLEARAFNFPSCSSLLLPASWRPTLLSPLFVWSLALASACVQAETSGRDWRRVAGVLEMLIKKIGQLLFPK